MNWVNEWVGDNEEQGGIVYRQSVSWQQRPLTACIINDHFFLFLVSLEVLEGQRKWKMIT